MDEAELDPHELTLIRVGGYAYACHSIDWLAVMQTRWW